MEKGKLFEIIENLKEEQGYNSETLLKEIFNYLNSDDIEGFLRDFCRLRDIEYIYFEEE
jgi:hypothetical protein